MGHTRMRHNLWPTKCHYIIATNALIWGIFRYKKKSTFWHNFLRLYKKRQNIKQLHNNKVHIK